MPPFGNLFDLPALMDEDIAIRNSLPLRWDRMAV